MVCRGGDLQRSVLCPVTSAISSAVTIAVGFTLVAAVINAIGFTLVAAIVKTIGSTLVAAVIGTIGFTLVTAVIGTIGFTVVAAVVDAIGFTLVTAVVDAAGLYHGHVDLQTLDANVAHDIVLQRRAVQRSPPVAVGIIYVAPDVGDDNDADAAAAGGHPSACTRVTYERQPVPPRHSRPVLNAKYVSHTSNTTHP